MSLRKLPLMVKISSSLSTAIFYCRIIAEFIVGLNSHMNVYLTSTVKLNSVKFHGGTRTQTRRVLCHTVVG